jgi:hypothetical protein
LAGVIARGIDKTIEGARASDMYGKADPIAFFLISLVVRSINEFIRVRRMRFLVHFGHFPENPPIK